MFTAALIQFGIEETVRNHGIAILFEEPPQLILDSIANRTLLSLNRSWPKRKSSRRRLASANKPAQQVNRSQIEIKLGSYGVCPASALSDPSLLPRVQDYKRQVAGRMIPLDRREISKRILPADYHASRKVDGEFTVLVYRDGEIFTVNPAAPSAWDCRS